MRLYHIVGCLLGLSVTSCVATGKKCSTWFGTKSIGHVPTTTKTVTTTVKQNAVVTKTPKKTITPPPVTTTTVTTSISTVTSTTQTTDTATSIISFTETSTSTATTSTITETDTVTTGTETTTTSTSTVAATAGYTPIQSSVAGSSYSGQFGGPMARRGVRKSKQPKKDSMPGQCNKNDYPRKQYPNRVTCTVTTTVRAACKTSTKTAPTKTITAPVTTITTTSTSTVITTTTSALEPADTTVTTSTTFSETTTLFPSTTTTVSTTATTTTTVQATATSYAQCNARDNYADTLDGTYGVQVNANDGSNNFMLVSGPTNALECCNLCASQANCGLSSWAQSNGGCYISQGCGGPRQEIFQQNVDFIFNNGCQVVVRR